MHRARAGRAGVDPTDFALAKTLTANGAAVTVTGTGATYTVTSASVTGEGTLGLNLVDDDTIKDSAGNALGGSSSGALAGQSYTIDHIGPTVTSVTTTHGSVAGKLEAGDTFVVTFGEAIASGLPSATPITESKTLAGNPQLSIASVTSGALDMGPSGYITAVGSATFDGTSALSNGGKTITVTAGSCTSLVVACLLVGQGNTGLTYSPPSTLRDAAGNGAGGSTAVSAPIF